MLVHLYFGEKRWLTLSLNEAVIGFWVSLTTYYSSSLSGSALFAEAILFRIVIAWS